MCFERPKGFGYNNAHKEQEAGREVVGLEGLLEVDVMMI